MCLSVHAPIHLFSLKTKQLHSHSQLSIHISKLSFANSSTVNWSQGNSSFQVTHLTAQQNKCYFYIFCLMPVKLKVNLQVQCFKGRCIWRFQECIKKSDVLMCTFSKAQILQRNNRENYQCINQKRIFSPREIYEI